MAVGNNQNPVIFNTADRQNREERIMKTMKRKRRKGPIRSSIPLKVTGWLWPLLLITAFLTVLPGPAAACTVTTTADSGVGSLRECIIYANSNPGESITFDIPATDPGYVTSGPDSWWRISPTSVLPVIIAAGTIIDGTTQTINRGDTNSLGPEIQIDGAFAGAVVDGLSFSGTSDGSVVRGLMITRFTRDGVLIQSGTEDITIAGNWIGTDGTGASSMGNGDEGIEVLGGGNNIGGTGADDRNVIVNNGDEGINLTGAWATGNIIRGNYIGLEPDGTSGTGNGDVGIALLAGAVGNTIGGLTEAERNVISMNYEGIEINTAGNVILGNYIGTDTTGTLDRGNRSDDGIEIQGGGNNNAIGGTASGAGNLIAYNQLHGITVKAGSGNRILGNSVHSNNLMGIDLNDDGVTPNNGTTGAFPNIGMDYPVLSVAILSGTDLHVEGYVGTSALKIAGTHMIEFFKVEDDGGSSGEVESGDGQSIGHGEGRWYIDRCLSAADGTFDCDLTVSGPVSLTLGESITGTATDTAGNTSEFGGNLAVLGTCSPIGGDTLYLACFDDQVLDQTPVGWVVSPPANGVVVKVDGPTQVLSDGTAGGAPVTSGNPAWTDVSVLQRFRTVSGGIDHAGVIARYVDDGNMVYGGIVTATTAEIWNRIGGTWTQLGPTWTIPDVSSGWHIQELRVAGDHVDLYVDGALIGGAILMPGAPAAGKTGFWSQYGAREGYRDDHTVREAYLVDGIIFEDTDFTGTPAAYDGGVTDLPLEFVDVEIYDDADVYVGSANTSSDGRFKFVVHNGSYKVRARSATIGDADTPPAGGLNPAVPATWPYPLPEVTWGDGVAMLGGQSPTADDTDTGNDAGPGDTWVAVTVSGGDVTGVDLGFAYNLIVNTEDDGLANTVRSDQGSLRQFIKNVNASQGRTVSFHIPDTDPGYITAGADSWWRISPTSILPAVTAAGTVIDGSTQTTNRGDTNSRGPEIALDGSLAGAASDGLVINSPVGGSIVRDLAVGNFARNGILLQAGSSVIAGNYIGLDADGSTITANNTSSTALQGGIRVESAGNTIGGTSSDDRNIISGNILAGIVIAGAGASGNLVLGNYIGLDASGTLDRGNTNDGEGIEIHLADSNIIGGTVAGTRNVISGNESDGIEIDGGDLNIIQGNYFGTDSTGTFIIANDRDGIDINADGANGATGNIVGGTIVGSGNLIRGNAMNGVQLREDTVAGSTINNQILGNSIYDNGQLGIDLEPDGITANDPDDGDAGPNNLQNYPVLTSIVTNGVSSTISGTLNSTPDTTFRLEFFSNSVADPLGYGEGESFLGTASVTTDGTGDVSFSINLPVALSPGDYVSATATDPAGSTSEFAANAVIPLVLVKQAFLASDGLLISNSSTLPRGTVLKFLIYIDNTGPARSDVSVQDLLDPAFAYSTGSLKVDNSVASGETVGAIYAAVNALSPHTDEIDTDVVSITGATISAGDRFVANGRLDIAANRIWALLFTVRMQ